MYAYRYVVFSFSKDGFLQHAVVVVNISDIHNPGHLSFMHDCTILLSISYLEKALSSGLYYENVIVLK